MSGAEPAYDSAMTVRETIRMTEGHDDTLDELVKADVAASRSDAIRKGIERLAEEELDR